VYARLDPPLSRGLIHGDARVGDLMPVAGGRWLLGDWDSVSVGPRVQDLVPSVLAHRRFERSRAAWERLCRTYGVDPGVEKHPAVRLLCRARELRSLAAYLRTEDRPEVAAELAKRLRTLMTCDHVVWRTV
jgi:aminoglycoside phosphotransferase (APT) family kinase protein